MNPNISIKTITVAANATVSVNITGSYLLITSNSGNFNFSLDGGPMQPGLSILGIDVTRNPNLLGSVTAPLLVAPQFKEIIFKDTSGAANVITFIVANFAVTYINPLPTVVNKDASTYVKGTNGVLLASSGTGTTYNGLDSGHIRRQIAVTNESATKVLQLLDGSGNRAATIQPGQTYTIATNGTINVFNPDVSASVFYSVLETFYS